jgi:hypothetical protein
MDRAAQILQQRRAADEERLEAERAAYPMKRAARQLKFEADVEQAVSTFPQDAEDRLKNCDSWDWASKRATWVWVNCYMQEPMVEKLRLRYPGYDFVPQDADQLDERSEQFFSVCWIEWRSRSAEAPLAVPPARAEPAAAAAGPIDEPVADADTEDEPDIDYM